LFEDPSQHATPFHINLPFQAFPNESR